MVRRHVLGARGQVLRNGEHALLVAVEDGVSVASLITGVDRRANRLAGESRGYFARFEAQDNQAAVSALFADAARYQAALGVRRMVGPCPLDGSGFMMGVLVEGGYELLNPVNPAHYDRLIIGAGLAVETEWLSYDVDAGAEALDRYVAAAEWARERHGFEVAQLDLRRGRATYQELQSALELHSRLTPGEFAAQLDAVKRYCDRRLVLVARRRGVPCGMMLGLCDRHAREVRLATVHVAEAQRRSPALVALLGSMVARVRELAPERVTISVIDAGNMNSRLLAVGAGAVLARKYRQYSMSI